MRFGEFSLIVRISLSTCVFLRKESLTLIPNCLLIAVQLGNQNKGNKVKTTNIDGWNENVDGYVANIDGYQVEIEKTPDGYVVGWVKSGRFSASVECMRQFGALNDGEESISVPARTRGRIYKWAIAHGY